MNDLGCLFTRQKVYDFSSLLEHMNRNNTEVIHQGMIRYIAITTTGTTIATQHFEFKGINCSCKISYKS